MPRSESGIGSVPGISVSALECIGFGLCFLGVVEKTVQGATELSQRGARKGEAVLLPLAFLHFNCMSRRKVCNEVDTGLQPPFSPTPAPIAVSVSL